VIRYLLVLAASAAWGQSRESIEAQRKSVQVQRETLLLYRTPEPSPVEPPDCDPLPDAKIDPILETAAKAQKLPAKLLRSVAAQESGLRPCAVSKKGAQGLMQLMPSTAEELAVQDPLEPAENVAAGARYLRQLIDKYAGDLGLALAAYNAGPASVDAAKGIPDIPETRDYVKAILDKVGIKRLDPPK
jgi:soluble lytic murein transglycosylase-like protein